MAWTANLHAHAFRISALGIAFGFAALGFAGGASAASAKLKPLHGFCKKTGCPDGMNPYLGPTVDSSTGDLYGTTLVGGLPNGFGVVYQLHPKGKKYKFRILYTFCPTTPCTDGAEPLNQPIVDTAGNLYGTTTSGGTFGFGTVYELVRGADPKTRATTWTHVTLYNFCPAGATPCVDGNGPDGRLAYPGSLTGARYDGKSPFYGTAAGGTGNAGTGSGVIFQIKPGTTTATEQVIYNYCSLPSCTDGDGPFDVIMDANGNLYSATTAGGQNNEGAVTEVDPKAKVEGVLYSFCPQPTCQDGATPLSPLGMDAKGNIFGTTVGGGVTNSGVVFKVVPNGVLSTEKVVYSFCGKTDCVDGLVPFGGVSVDSSGNVFGTTIYGGAFPGTNCDSSGHGCGIVFEVHGSSFKVLHSFCETGPTSCKDGAAPFFGPVTLDQAGNVYGAALVGGAHQDGVIWKVTP